MSEPKKPNEIDDLSETKPFIVGSKKREEFSYRSDWEKTNYLASSESEFASSSDREKTSMNINIEGQKSEHEFFYPESDWENKTRVDLYLRDVAQSKSEKEVAPVSQEAYPAKQTSQKQNFSVPQKSNTEATNKSGIPTWFFYASIGIMFVLIAGTIILSYLLFSKKYGFDVVLIGAHPNSDVFVDGIRWGISSFDGSIRLIGLRAGEHRIEVKNPNYLYDIETVRGNDGEQTKVTLKYRAKTSPTPALAPVPNECNEIKKDEYEKAARCANEALDKLGDKFTIEELLRAMNLYIINFDSGKYDIKPQDMKFLERAASYMKKLPPNVKIEVGGHTDNVGGDDYNMKLSENRAKAVRDALVSFGVNPNMLEVRGYGKTRPKASNDTEDGRFQNRRIEYTAIIR
jgi:outer membrane protein OmpA-like peptidoglycan-associated protein